MSHTQSLVCSGVISHVEYEVGQYRRKAVDKCLPIASTHTLDREPRQDCIYISAHSCVHYPYGKHANSHLMVSTSMQAFGKLKSTTAASAMEYARNVLNIRSRVVLIACLACRQARCTTEASRPGLFSKKPLASFLDLEASHHRCCV